MRLNNIRKAVLIKKWDQTVISLTRHNTQKKKKLFKSIKKIEKITPQERDKAIAAYFAFERRRFLVVLKNWLREQEKRRSLVTAMTLKQLPAKEPMHSKFTREASSKFESQKLLKIRQAAELMQMKGSATLATQMQRMTLGSKFRPLHAEQKNEGNTQYTNRPVFHYIPTTERLTSIIVNVADNKY